jgi:hypothetical protein
MAGSLIIKPGRNLWLLARTDRDAASNDEVRLTCAAFLTRVLPGAAGPVPPASPGGPSDASRYFLGAARPIDISASQDRIRVPKGIETWTREEQPELYAVNAERPWYVLADFDWRGQTTPLPRWPTRVVNDFGVATTDPQHLDWLLLYAAHMGPASRPDGSWSGAVVDKATEITIGMSTGLLLLAGLYLYATHHNDR